MVYDDLLLHGGECPQTPLAVHALVHINNTPTKGSPYKHIRKGDFLSENAPENELRLLEI